LYYALYAAPRDMPRNEPDTWEAAQPSYGVATNEREIRSKLQKAKTLEQRAIFDADYLGWGDYPPDEEEISSPIPEAIWGDMANPDAKLIGSRV
ncbi:terminase, partial [Mycobacteroides abscessus subsp. abscessus]